MAEKALNVKITLDYPYYALKLFDAALVYSQLVNSEPPVKIKDFGKQYDDLDNCTTNLKLAALYFEKHRKDNQSPEASDRTSSRKRLTIQYNLI